MLTPTRTPPRVLVVDDEESIRMFAERVLRDAGYDVVVASDGLEALSIVDEQAPFDVFVLDILMPQMRGDELGRRLRCGDPDAKVLYFTGHSDRLFEDRKVLWENEAFIEKPVTVKGLLEAISMMIFGHLQGLVDSARVPGRASSRESATVLIVDDDPGVTETFARMLELEGYDVRTAVTAEAGLNEAEVGRPDAILLDLRMPIVDGLAFLRRLRAQEHLRHTPVAIVTGDYFLDDMISRELGELSAQVYFKPLWLEDLVRITKTLVNLIH